MASAPYITREPTEEHIEAWFRCLRLIGGKPFGVCRPNDLAYAVGTETRHAFSCGCGAETLALVPFEGAREFARVCAVCDAATEFPRLKP